MDERIMQFRVGVMVLATLIIAGILVLIFGEMSTLFEDKRTIYIHLPQAPGVLVDTPIRKSGILIGRVEDVEFEEGGVVVTAEVRDGVVAETDVARVSANLLGDAVMEIVAPTEDAVPRVAIQDEGHIEGLVVSDVIAMIANLESRLAGAVDSFGATSDEIGRLARQVNDILDANESQVNRIIAKSEQSLDRIQSAATSLDELVSDPQIKEDLKQSLRELPEMLKETRETISQVQQTMSGMEKTIQAANRNLENVEGFTRPLGERGEQIVSRLDDGAAKLDRLLNEMLVFSSELNDSDGALSQLVHNPDLYQNLNAAARNIEKLTREFRPIVADARVFSDKIARHPESLGVRGAIQPSSGAKWIGRRDP